MPRDPSTGWIEPEIVINGVQLTFAECMTVRVAVATFRLSLSDPPMREGIGEQLAENYDYHLAQVELAMRRRPHP